MAQLNDVPVKLYCRGRGTPLILLHGLGVDHHFWDFASVLEDEFAVCVYDLPGHGATIEPRESYSIADLSTHLADVLEENRITRAHIVGMSLGGLIAQHFAANFPEQVEKLILIDTTARYTDEMRAIWPDRSAAAQSAGVKALIPDLLKIWFSRPFLERNPPAVEYVRAALSHSSGRGYALARDALAKADLRQDVARIEAPTLIMCGKDDLPSFLDAAQWLADHIPDAKLAWLPDARHAAVLEQPNVALAQMRDFLL
jgi:3-oxoadipate enol-lactonase